MENVYMNQTIDKLPIEVLKNCAENQIEDDCIKVKIFNKEMEGKNNTIDWKHFANNTYDGLIPLCGFASDNLILKNCKVFKKMLNNQMCFTFNESSFDHRVGLTQGVNLLVNFDYPGIKSHIDEPVTITLHEPNQKPDIMNILGKNFRVAPGKDYYR